MTITVRYTPMTITRYTPKIPNGAIIRVHGWVMLAKVDPGDYRIEHGKAPGGTVYKFFRPRGRKVIVRHYADIVDTALNPPGDINRIEVLHHT